jgi:hypothetical protein
MIWESSDWKEPLLLIANRLRKLKTSGELTEKQLARVERDIFIGFYSVRKLIETITKITDDTKAMKVDVEYYLYNQIKPVTLLNWHRIEEFYDFGEVHNESRDIKFICGRIIHSFIFMPLTDENGLTGILFTSDIDKHKKLYSLNIDEVIKIFKRIGNDYPYSEQWTINPETGEETIIVK